MKLHGQRALRWLIGTALILSLLSLRVHAVAFHAHGDNAFHGDCSVCQAAVAQHAVLSGIAIPLEHLLRIVARVDAANQTSVVQFFQKPSSARAPPCA
jgi:hypothetical protein